MKHIFALSRAIVLICIVLAMPGLSYAAEGGPIFLEPKRAVLTPLDAILAQPSQAIPRGVSIIELRGIDAGVFESPGFEQTYSTWVYHSRFQWGTRETVEYYNWWKSAESFAKTLTPPRLMYPTQ